MSVLSAVGSFLGGAAGLVTALAAYRGIEAWRFQITSGKYIAIVWSCEEKLREFQLDFIDFQAQYAIQSSRGICNESKKNIERLVGELNAKLPSLVQQFSYIDSVIEKNGHQWSNYISVNVTCALSEYLGKCLNENKALESEIANLGAKNLEVLNSLHGRLDNLEEKIIKI